MLFIAWACFRNGAGPKGGGGGAEGHVPPPPPPKEAESALKKTTTFLSCNAERKGEGAQTEL